MQVLGEAVKGAGTLDQDKLTAYLHSRSFHTILGDISFGADGDWKEARIVFELLLERTSAFQLDRAHPPAYANNVFVRRHEHLHLQVDWA